MISPDERPYWLGFHLVQGIGAARMAHLLAEFGSAQAAWRASAPALQAAGLGNPIIKALEKVRTQRNLTEEFDKVRALGVRLLLLPDPDYPAALRNLSDAPLVLYVRGELIPQDALSLAVVGTRRASRYGRDVAEHLSMVLARHDVTIVSGLASGVDAAAHAGALKAGGRTIAILGNGIDRVYPQEHSEMAEHIYANGALITEFPIGMPPMAGNFPRRNRLLSGMALGVLVVEAPENSGALITAEAALEQGKDVFAVPNNIFNPMGTGANRLIQEGAKLVMQAQDILEDLNITYEQHSTQRQASAIVPEDPNEARVFAQLDHEPLHVDEITRLSGLDAPTVAATLTVLELKGLAQNCGAMQYCRTR